MKLGEYLHLNSQIKQLSKEIKASVQLNHDQIVILHYILNTDNNKASLKEIEKYIDLSKTLTSRYVKDLIDKEYLSKQWSESDERERILHMNEKQIENTLTALELIEEYINEKVV